MEKNDWWKKRGKREITKKNPSSKRDETHIFSFKKVIPHIPSHIYASTTIKFFKCHVIESLGIHLNCLRIITYVIVLIILFLIYLLIILFLIYSSETKIISK